MLAICISTLGILITNRQQESVMSFISWLLLGLVAGFIGSKLVNRTGEGIVRDILLGVVGAFIGGFLFNIFGAAGVTGLNLYSLMVAVVGAIVFLVGYHAIFRRRRSIL
jgi:uncharacterized membrane protein YeaQ/YmgE (transglycosylase-associated protein family)